MEIYKEFNNLQVAITIRGEEPVYLFRQLEIFVKDLYHETCKDFGILNPFKMDVFLCKELDDRPFGVTLGRCITWFDREIVEVFFHTGMLKILPNELYRVTVPHEVAHAIADQMFPEKSVGHGNEWKEMMKYFKLPAHEFHGISTEVAKLIVNFGEL